MLLTVPNTSVNTSNIYPFLRQQLPEVTDRHHRYRGYQRGTLDRDDPDTGVCHYYFRSPHRAQTEAADVGSTMTGKRWKRPSGGVHDSPPSPASSDPSPRPVRPRDSSGDSVDDCSTPDEFSASRERRPHSCDTAQLKSILATYRCHDCSMENVRTFVSGQDGRLTQRRAGAARTDNPGSCASERKSVRFAPMVRVQDESSAISFCQLRHHTSSSAPSCSLPALPTGGCVGSLYSADDRLDGLPAVVERYMVRCGGGTGRQRHFVDELDTTKSRLPPVNRPIRRA